MNPEMKELWVKALRSRKFKKGQGRLKTRDGHYCCLGVLCHVTGETDYESDNWLPSWLRLKAKIPHDIEELLGRANDGDLTLSEGKDFRNYTDGEGASFKSIADYIEEHL